jgi:glutaconyl-CoA/methylmalonyl-CoA decarboxylase subunit gamma
MKYVVTINSKKYEVEVEKGQASIVSTANVEVPVIVPHMAPAAAPAALAAAAVQKSPAPSGPDIGKGEVIKAPMPGTLLDIKISEGVKVKKGQVLFILEAMKMENEIMSPIDGTVVQIKAAKGSAVSTGDILAVIQS